MDDIKKQNEFLKFQQELTTAQLKAIFDMLNRVLEIVGSDYMKSDLDFSYADDLFTEEFAVNTPSERQKQFLKAIRN